MVETKFYFFLFTTSAFNKYLVFRKKKKSMFSVRSAKIKKKRKKHKRSHINEGDTLGGGNVSIHMGLICFYDLLNIFKLQY